MKSYADIEGLLALEQDVLKLVVDEGQQKLAAQLSTATAGDQRALTLIGYQITAATGSFAASAALATSAETGLPLVTIGFSLAVLLLIAAFKAMNAVRPKLLSFPGNLPQNWIPSEWTWAPPITLA